MELVLVRRSGVEMGFLRPVPSSAHFLALSILGQAEWGLGSAWVKCERAVSERGNKEDLTGQALELRETLFSP